MTANTLTDWNATLTRLSPDRPEARRILREQHPETYAALLAEYRTARDQELQKIYAAWWPK
ncbi:MAG TPA: hypothetical protein PK869_11485 [Candidatus Hydrogenedentes bacterium]|nr:hypothetical protein [Candidatus Hydrogenedentota bacterium]